VGTASVELTPLGESSAHGRVPALKTLALELHAGAYRARC